jgi:hypothetical protein
MKANFGYLLLFQRLWLSCTISASDREAMLLEQRKE